MNPEQARLLRDKTRGNQWPRDHHALGTRKQHLIHFGSHDAEQLQQAHQLLLKIEGLQADIGEMANKLWVRYDLYDHTLHGIESLLIRAGFALSNSPLYRLKRALIHFAEETEVRNLHGPQRLIKKSQDIYSKAWENHPHGDHDDTPPDLRAEK